MINNRRLTNDDKNDVNTNGIQSNTQNSKQTKKKEEKKKSENRHWKTETNRDIKRK